VSKRRVGLQDGDVGTDPDVVADGDWLADAVPLEALVEPHGMSNADNAAIRANVAALANDHVGHGRVHDHAVPVDEGGAADMQAEAVVDVDGRLDKGGLGLEGRVGEGLIVGYGQYAIPGAIAVWADDAASVLVKKRGCPTVSLAHGEARLTQATSGSAPPGPRRPECC
jgi:hypothetical protein